MLNFCYVRIEEDARTTSMPDGSRRNRSPVLVTRKIIAQVLQIGYLLEFVLYYLFVCLLFVSMFTIYESIKCLETSVVSLISPRSGAKPQVNIPQYMFYYICKRSDRTALLAPLCPSMLWPVGRLDVTWFEARPGRASRWP